MPHSQNNTQTRRKPGSTGKGDYYHVEVLPKYGFVTFRTQDVGKSGHIQRVAGKRASGSWATVKWLIGKNDAHVRGDRLVADTKGARDLIKELGAQPIHVTGDRFKAKASSAAGVRKAKSSAQPPARRTNVKKKQPVARAKKSSAKDV